MTHVFTNDRHESQSRNKVTIFVEEDGYDEPFEISAGTICNHQMTQCRINRYQKGRGNPLGYNFPILTFAVHGVILQEATDLWIQMTTNQDSLVRLHIQHGHIGGAVQHVSIGDKCKKRWDFRELATEAMQGTDFEIHNDQGQHIATLVIMLDFPQV